MGKLAASTTHATHQTDEIGEIFIDFPFSKDFDFLQVVLPGNVLIIEMHITAAKVCEGSLVYPLLKCQQLRKLHN